MRTTPGKIILLSGKSGSGKTWLLSQLMELLKDSSLIMRGILSPPVEETDKKVGIALVNLETGEIRQVARLREKGIEGLYTQKWQFDARVMGWGNEILRTACPCNLLIIDELGPLEFERNQGWQNGLMQLDNREFDYALVVVRPSLITAAKHRWADAIVVNVNRDNQRKIIQELIAILQPKS